MINVLDFGARGRDSSFDNTPAFRAALAALGTSPGVVFVPAGNYRVTAGFTIGYHGQHIVGEGRNSSLMTWDAGAGTLFTFRARSGGVAQQNGLRGIGCYSPNRTQKKVAVSIVDCSEFFLEDFAVGPSIGGWTGAGSVGLQTRGRELSTFSRLAIAADLPIVIEPNASAPNTLADCDHFHFSDTYLLPSGGNPSVTIAPGVVPSNLTFDGYNAWVLGGYGLKWDDTSSSAGSAQNIRIANVRFEQSTLPAGYAVYISPHASAQFIRLENVYCGADGRGVYLRRATNVTMAGVVYTGRGVAIDCDASCDNINWDNCFWQAGSTVHMAGLVKALMPVRASSGAYPDALTANWTKATNATPWGRVFGVFQGAGQGTLANGGSVTLPFTGDQNTGFVMVTARGATQQELAIFSIGGKPTRVKKASGTLNTADTNAPNRLCLIESGTSPILVNNLGESVHYSWHTQWA